MRTCPSCRFLVGDTDASCEFCGADLAAGAPPPNAPNGRGTGAGFPSPPGPGVGGGRPPRSGPSTGLIIGIVIGVVGGFFALIVLFIGAVTFLGTAEETSRFSAIDDSEVAKLTTTTVSWAPWTAPDGSFSVELPGTPEVTTVPVELPTGSLNQTMAMVDQGPRAAFVSWFDIPPPFDLEGSAQGSASEAGGELINTQPTTLAGLDALRYTVTMPNGGTVAGIVAQDGVGRAYLLLAADTANPEAALDRMAASFTRP